jgi:hypothetical protein
MAYSMDGLRPPAFVLLAFLGLRFPFRFTLV